MSHEVLITRRLSIFNFFANPGRGGPQHPVPASTSQHRTSEAHLCLDLQKKIKMLCHLVIRTLWDTSPWSVLTWITLICMYSFTKYHIILPFSFIEPSQCQSLRVELKNNALISQGSRQGIFTLSSIENGRPIWIKSGSQAQYKY